MSNLDIEHVRQYPNMYLGELSDTTTAQLAREVIGFAVTRYRNGLNSKIGVSISKDGLVSVTDNDDSEWFIPQGIDCQNRDLYLSSSLRNCVSDFGFKGYAFNCGLGLFGALDGIGLPAVNALSQTFHVSHLHGRVAIALSFRRGFLDPTSKPACLQMTRFAFCPDSVIFGNHQIPSELVLNRCQLLVYLNKGLQIDFFDERNDTQLILFSDSGLLDYIKKLSTNVGNPISDIFCLACTIHDAEVEIAIRFCDIDYDIIDSFVNTTRTGGYSADPDEAGSHVRGFKIGLSKALSQVCENPDLQSEVKIPGYVAAVSVFMNNPKYVDSKRLIFEDHLLEAGITKHTINWIRNVLKNDGALIERLQLSITRRAFPSASSRVIVRTDQLIELR